MELTSEEGRLLGCLVEKQLSTPQLYPLTEKALIAACNQTTSRDPVVAYDVATVRRTARSLREKGLLRMVHRPGERSDKHQHLLDSSLGLSHGQVTLLAILLLRGPQTLAELRARSERMHPFATIASAQEAMDALTDRDDPLAARLERLPGRKEARYGQLLVALAHPFAGVDHLATGQPSDRTVPSAPLAALAPLAAVAPPAPLAPPAPPLPSAPMEGVNLVALVLEVDRLRDEVAELRAQVGGLREIVERG